jgi:transposase
MNNKILEHAAIIKLHNDGFENWEISKKLEISRSGRNKVKRTIDRYKETGSLQNRGHKNHKVCSN